MTKITRTGGVNEPNRKRISGQGRVSKSAFTPPKKVEPTRDSKEGRGPEGGALNAMRNRIAEGISKGWSREKTLSALVDDETEAGFKKSATPAMRQSITEAIQDNVELKNTFNRLYDRIAKELKPERD